MATHTVQVKRQISRPTAVGQALTSPRFDTIIAGLGVVLISGVHLDGWGHIHTGLIETFFTPWHGVLYAGFLALTLVMVGTVWMNRTRGFRGWRAIPVGYEPAMIGVVLFALGGVGDMLWHLVFGIEIDLEALLSPTHLLLAVGGGLIVSGPLRAAWIRRDGQEPSMRSFLPVALSAAMLLSALTFMTQYMHPFGTTWAAAARRPGTFFGAGASGMTVEGFSVLSYFRFFEQLAALSGIVVQTVILMGIIVTLLRRWKLQVGVMTVLMTLNAALTTLMRDRFLDTGPVPLIVVAALAGLTADLLAARLQLSPSRLSGLRLYAFLVPVILYTLYFLALWVDGGTWWRVHVWSGAIIIAGISGWLLSYLVVPPLKETTG